MTIGSYIPPETPGNQFQSMSFLNIEGIMAKHKLQRSEIERIKHKLHRQKFLDILFHYPDGPRYDLALYLIATSR
jgi:hypothetical protein